MVHSGFSTQDAAEIVAGEGPVENPDLVEDLCNTMEFGSLYALGGFSPCSVMSAIKHFPEDFGRAASREAAE